jgi:hypothetical protein
MSINTQAKTTAVNLRKQLKNQYPNTTFSVRTRMSGWMTVLDVEWTDGPTVKEIDNLVEPLANAKFDENNDDAWNRVAGVDTGITMVSTTRRISKTLSKQIADFLSVTFDGYRFSHKDEFAEAVDHLFCSPKTWAELANNDMALMALVRWIANESSMVSGLVEIWQNCEDF